MKPHALICVLLLLFTSCAGCGPKGDGDISGEMRYMILAAVHAPRTKEPSTETLMSVMIGFRGGDAAEKEIRSREAALSAAAVRFGALVEREDLTDVERYEKLRERLRGMFNAELTRPFVGRVVFREIRIR